MVTKGIENAVKQVLFATYYDGGLDADAYLIDKIVEKKTKEMLALLRAEAINLADQIIGKDIEVSSEINPDWTDERLVDNKISLSNKQLQSEQRIRLASYQNMDRLHKESKNPIIPDWLPGTDQLSENEE